MKINNVPGEFGFKALFRNGSHEFGWRLTDSYFLTFDEAL